MRTCKLHIERQGRQINSNLGPSCSGVTELTTTLLCCNRFNLSFLKKFDLLGIGLTVASEFVRPHTHWKKEFDIAPTDWCPPHKTSGKTLHTHRAVVTLSATKTNNFNN